jgi:hypothetical protein
MECDRDDCDGITPSQFKAAIDNGWKEVERVRSYREACETCTNPEDEPPEFSVLGWWTHIGYCPECAKELDRERESTKSKQIATLARVEAESFASENLFLRFQRLQRGFRCLDALKRRPLLLVLMLLPPPVPNALLLGFVALFYCTARHRPISCTEPAQRTVSAEENRQYLEIVSALPNEDEWFTPA